MEYVCYVTLQQRVPAGETDETTGIQNAVKEQETASRTQQTFQLPDTVNGQKVTWRKKVDYRPLFLPVLFGIVLIICIQQKPLQDKKKEQKLREKELLKRISNNGHADVIAHGSGYDGGNSMGADRRAL